MPKYIDQNFWWESLAKPDWYLRLADDFNRLEEIAKSSESQPGKPSIKKEAYELIEKAISEVRIPLAPSGPNLDKGRAPIDTVVIHHTKNQPGMSLERLNAMQLLRIYGRYYGEPQDPNEKNFKGQPIWSGHFYKDRQVFWVYHWLVKQDGQAEHLLKDDYIGWHAGNWDTNTRSIAICVDDDLSDKQPNPMVLKSIAQLIKIHYPQVKEQRIIGHNDANPKTECPGRLFHQAWRQEIINWL